MKYKVKILAGILLLALSVYSAAPAMFGADLGYKSKYIWRGIPFNNQSVFWPDAWINWNELTLTGFWSIDITDTNGYQGKITEFDIILDYSHTFKFAALSVGYFHFNYPNDQGYPPTGEFYTNIGTNLKVVNLTLSNYFDCLAVGGYWFSPSIEVAHTFKELFTPSLKLSLGYGSKKHNAYWIGVNKSGLTDFTGTINLALVLPGKAGEYMSISADANISKLLDEDFVDAFKDNDFNFWAGFYINTYFGVGGGE